MFACDNKTRLPALTQFRLFQSRWSWRPRLLLAATILLHLAVLILVVLTRTLWLYGLALVLLNHIVLAALGLSPRHAWMGANLTKLPDAASSRREVALTFDDGPDPLVTPQVLDILDHYHARATFFCVGREAARYPELCREIVRRGHSVENHTQLHRHTFALLGRRAYLSEIRTAQMTLEQACGAPPRFFRAPAGFRNIFLAPVLRGLGLQLVSWSVRGFDTYVCDSWRVRRRLIKGLQPGAILLMHDGNAARDESQVPIVLAVLPSVLQAANEAGLQCVSLREACLPESMMSPTAFAWNARHNTESQQQHVAPASID